MEPWRLRTVKLESGDGVDVAMGCLDRPRPQEKPCGPTNDAQTGRSPSLGDGVVGLLRGGVDENSVRIPAGGT